MIAWAILSIFDLSKIAESLLEREGEVVKMAFWRRQPEEPKWPAAPAEVQDCLFKDIWAHYINPIFCSYHLYDMICVIISMMCDNVDVQHFCTFALIMILWFPLHIYLYLYRYIQLQFRHPFMHYVDQCIQSVCVIPSCFDLDWLFNC